MGRLPNGLMLSLSLGVFSLTVLTNDALACVVRFDSQSGGSVLLGSATGYDVYEDVELIETASVGVEHISGDPCRVAVTIASDQPGDPRTLSGPGTLPYVIYGSLSGREILVNDADPLRDATLEVDLTGPGDRKVLDYFPGIPPGQVVTPGDYEDTLTLSLYENSSGTFALADTRQTAIRTSVRERTDITVALSDSDFSVGQSEVLLDLGTLETGVSGKAFIIVRSNSSYNVEAWSENLSHLVHRQEGSEWTIGYDATLDGQQLALGGGSPVRALTDRPSTQSDGTSHEFEVVIGDTTRRRAGDYEDVVYFRVLPIR